MIDSEQFHSEADENLAASGCQEKERDKIALFWPCLEKNPHSSCPRIWWIGCKYSRMHEIYWAMLQILVKFLRKFALALLYSFWFHSLINFLLPSFISDQCFFTVLFNNYPALIFMLVNNVLYNLFCRNIKSWDCNCILFVFLCYKLKKTTVKELKTKFKSFFNYFLLDCLQIRHTTLIQMKSFLGDFTRRRLKIDAKCFLQQKKTMNSFTKWRGKCRICCIDFFKIKKAAKYWRRQFT